MLLILHPLFKESLIFQKPRYLWQNLGPTGWTSLRSCLNGVQICVPKNDLGKDVLAFRTQKKSEFPLNPVFFTDLILIDKFSQISIHP